VITWTAVCPRCGTRQRSGINYNVEQAKAWAADWDKNHVVDGEVCSEREKGSTQEAGS
jgi:hypothetical protein